MRPTVVYRSASGATRQYAAWIAERLNCSAFTTQWITSGGVDKDDLVIFGGYVLDGKIVGLEKILSLRIPNLVVFAVGATPDCEEIRQYLRINNNLTSVPFFYIEGGFNIKKLNFLEKSVYKKFRKSLAKRENKSEIDYMLEEALDQNKTCCKIENIEELLSYARKRCSE